MLMLLMLIHFNFISYIDISMDILDIIIETWHTDSFQRSTQTSPSSWPSEDKASADLSVRARRRNIERVEFLVTQIFTTPDRQKGWNDEKTSVTSVLCQAQWKTERVQSAHLQNSLGFLVVPNHTCSVSSLLWFAWPPCLLRNVVRSQKSQLWGQVASCFPDCLCYQCCLPCGHVRLLRPALCCQNQFHNCIQKFRTLN